MANGKEKAGAVFEGGGVKGIGSRNRVFEDAGF